MSKLNHSNTKLYVITTITLAGAAFVSAGFVVPQTLAYARSESTRYTVRALNGQGTQAALDYKLAAFLDSRNEAAAIGLARVYLAQGQTDDAVVLLERIGDNQDGLRLRTQTLTELGKYAQAKKSADGLVKTGNEGDAVLAAAVYKLGNYGPELAALDTRLTSVGALQALSRLKAGEITQALELRALGLPVSSSALLLKLSPSVPRNLALGESFYAKGDEKSLLKAVEYLTEGIKLDPSNVELRQLYVNVLRAQKKVIEADAQDKLVLRLRQGKL